MLFITYIDLLLADTFYGSEIGPFLVAVSIHDFNVVWNSSFTVKPQIEAGHKRWVPDTSRGSR